MHEKALLFGVPFDELKEDVITKTSSVIAIYNASYCKFWEKYIHISSFGEKAYAHCYTATSDGEIVLRQNLQPDQLPRIAYSPKLSERLSMKIAEHEIRKAKNNSGVEVLYFPERGDL